VYDAAGQELPSADAFHQDSDLGEAAGTEAGSADSDEGLKWLLAGARSQSVDKWAQDSQWATSFPATTAVKKHVKVVPKRPVPKPLARASPMRMPSDKQLWRNAVAKAKAGSLDRSPDFSPTTLLQFSAPTTRDLKAEVSHEKSDVKRLESKVKRDMDIVFISGNKEDLKKGMAASRKLDRAKHKLHIAEHRAEELEDAKKGHANAKDVLDAATRIEAVITSRVQREHMRRLKLAAYTTRKDAYNAQMQAAKILQKSGSQHTEAVQRADAMADLKRDRSLGAKEALRAALGDSDQPFSPSAAPNVKIMMHSLKGGFNKKGLDKLATNNARKAEARLENALLTDKGFKNAARAAKVALAYEHTAAKTGRAKLTAKLKSAKATLQRASAAAENAMAKAVESGSHDAYIALRKRLLRRRDANDKVNNLERKIASKREADKRMRVDPTVTLKEEAAKDADAKFYADIKQAERAYSKVAEGGNPKNLGTAASRASMADKSNADSTKSELELAKVRTVRAGKKVANAKKAVANAIHVRRLAADALAKAKRYAYKAVYSQGTAKAMKAKWEDKLLTAQDQLADATATYQRIEARYRMSRRKKEKAHLKSEFASSKAKSAKRDEVREADKLNNDQTKVLRRTVRRLKRLKKKADAKKSLRVRRTRRQARSLNQSVHRTAVAKVRTAATSKLTQQMNMASQKAAEKGGIEEAKAARRHAISQGVKRVRGNLKALTTKPASWLSKWLGESKSDKVETEKFFDKTSQMHAKANQRAKQRRDGAYVRRHGHVAVRKLKQMQQQHKGLEATQQDLRKVLRVSRRAEKKIAKRFKKHPHTVRRAMKKEVRVAKAAMRAAKKATKQAAKSRSASAMKKALKKTKAAKALLNVVKAKKMKQTKMALKKKMTAVNKSVLRKRQTAKQAAIKISRSMEKPKSIAKAKAKILATRMKRETKTEDTLKLKLRQKQRRASRLKRRFSRRKLKAEKLRAKRRQAKKAKARYSRLVRKAKLQLHHAKRRIAIAKQVAKLADKNYKAARRELGSSQQKAKVAIKHYRTAQRDLREAEKSEQAMVAQVEKAKKRRNAAL
jgi:hypothetical protein